MGLLLFPLPLRKWILQWLNNAFPLQRYIVRKPDFSIWACLTAYSAFFTPHTGVVLMHHKKSKAKVNLIHLSFCGLLVFISGWISCKGQARWKSLISRTKWCTLSEMIVPCIYYMWISFFFFFWLLTSYFHFHFYLFIYFILFFTLQYCIGFAIHQHASALCPKQQWLQENLHFSERACADESVLLMYFKRPSVIDL